MEVVAIAATAVSAFGQIQAGKAQQAMYESQAVWNNIQAENDAIAYEQQGVNALKKTLKTMATITARAAAGNLNPFAGSIGGKSSFAGATGSPGGNPTYTLPKGPMFGGPTGWRV